MREADRLIPLRSRLPRVELVLRLADGGPWRLTVSSGMERFIGHYPRIDGIEPGGPLLRFTVLDPV
jgi:hypothetical protein